MIGISSPSSLYRHLITSVLRFCKGRPLRPPASLANFIPSTNERSKVVFVAMTLSILFFKSDWQIC
ncbi:Uncharacterised protein [Vibrio cholerae]|uniref:Uncharacterized protein n=1 Tax=Vibrio cholerae TaxID=666 RepID=A0A655TCH9_VIBCL|nr:Uncharacterised protein [Vibrio cholerae]CSB33931.1 Uncharacterised protein [Vibrio cholerae]CSC17913.1 Uncharacterised protein [Vibrio cholerae]CSC20746.1 Uncharacterised protein [Vibrio cholerae]CSC30259.1 Uncharacterised protein [Vibrio cholerae]